MNESDHKAKLVREVNLLPGGYARRWEDKRGVGILDLVLKFPDLPICWAEGKIVDGNVFGPTLRQFEEGKRIQAAGMVAVLIGWKSGVMYVSPWVEQADRRECFSGVRRYAENLRIYLNESR